MLIRLEDLHMSGATATSPVEKDMNQQVHVTHLFLLLFTTRELTWATE